MRLTHFPTSFKKDKKKKKKDKQDNKCFPFIGPLNSTHAVQALTTLSLWLCLYVNGFEAQVYLMLLICTDRVQNRI